MINKNTKFIDFESLHKLNAKLWALVINTPTLPSTLGTRLFKA